MYTEFVGIALVFGLAVAVAIPFGKFISMTFAGQKTFADGIFSPMERLVFRLSAIDPTREMDWKKFLKTMLGLNFLWLLLCYILLMFQGILPLNPDGNPSMSPDLALNTAISFVVNCNLQHYSGETGLSYLSQMFLMFLQFVSAGTGIAAAAGVFNAMRQGSRETIGNFYHFFVKSCTRILLPVATVIAVALCFSGTPMTFEAKDAIVTLQGDAVEVSRGPAAAFVAIKHLGTNGGGFFGANSAHPLENPTYFTNAVELWAQLLIPLAMLFALGFYLKRKRFSYVIFGVMTIGFLLLAVPTVVSEINGNPALTQMGIAQNGAMEGKEMRFGPAMTGFWSIATTVISTGSVNGMHDSMMPMSGAMQLLAMMVNAFYGGCGVGFLNFYVFIVLAVFISGLMVGRTPEFLGKKIEAREVKIAAFIAILHPLLILSGTALAAHFASSDTPVGYWFGGNASGWLNNPGAHGFTEMLYETTSSAANNGSGFEGLADNNPFWNVLTAFLLWFGRFLPIIGPVAIAGLLAKKKFIPESSGTLKTDTPIFGVMIFAVIAIIAALSFFPALALGPLAEYFSLNHI
ncbi:potassium-transporting ATPase subunit KdpA [Flavobacterium selenitireducens]|uniref:potassium-transporting ATPase subunit KdpA n=1 Tax=Flavobacterium selenitireducens TaxID=2722704 RepID=UPI00168C064D|nr:potassium-transporting ATPase subunit KdpA [Flavobacterium selenitireducens]MBD3581204.1 potassium-transporting ATPase subunit KdpA [Flavobacterium selenitireducens]